MPRLFLAIDFPESIRQELLEIQPAPVRGVRLTKPDQLHLTLHFLGETKLESTLAALQTVAASAFSLAMQGVGKFGSAHRDVILWAGVRNNPPLQSLHAALATTLTPIGYQPEPRPFSPHITLARCQSNAPRRVIEEFLQTNAGFATPEFPVAEFVLYSSELTPHGSVYHREQVYPLV